MDLMKLKTLLIPALEADDITATVQNQMHGGSAQDNTDTPKPVNDTNTLTQVDNLTTNLRENDPDDMTGNDTSPEEEDGPTDDNAPADDNPGENTIDTNEVGDDITDQPSGGDDTPNEEIPNQNEEVDTYMEKDVMRDNMITLHGIISADITKLTEYVSPIDDDSTIDVLNRVISNLRECKKVLYDIITDKLTQYTYVQLSTKYIAIKKIYDLSIAMIERHSEILNHSKNKKK